MKYCWEYAFISSPGDREINEDCIGYAEGECGECFVLCDGLGGHGKGDEASALVVDVFKDMFNQALSCKDFLGNAFIAAQEILMKKQSYINAKNKMKTTATVLIVDEKNAYIGHIGDSRVYVFNKNEVVKRTFDHSIPQKLVELKEIKENEIRNHPDRSLLLKVFGTEWNGEAYEIQKKIPLRRCQAFLLCSDGFWELIDETEMCNILASTHSSQEWLNKMQEIVLRNGEGTNMDNYSAIAVRRLNDGG